MLVPSDAVLISLITGIVSVVGAGLSAFVAYLTVRMKIRMVELEKNTNSIMDRLIVSTHKSALAEGTLEGRRQVITEGHKGGSIHDDPSILE